MDLIDERLNKIEGIIKDDSFRMKKGLGNEFGYYIFDYDPRDELKIRQYIKFLKKRSIKIPITLLKLLNLIYIISLLKYSKRTAI
ncbi:hypothetical protein [Methanobacterium ferruginis]|uniref:hypothetical protein n=1 Tax=Methanobacterium ferruginis TaxID=710191 RepID=UPI0025737990|nr:hypothetical protein [Methanobacterium ferruginis]BDZ68759.1 hypothetical protein GCM10025860_22070 [Methanobacterium ferruginis]